MKVYPLEVRAACEMICKAANELVAQERCAETTDISPVRLQDFINDVERWCSHAKAHVRGLIVKT